MQILFMLATIIVSTLLGAMAAPAPPPSCTAASTRALVRAAVERALAQQGVPTTPALFTLLDKLQEATSPASASVANAFRAKLSSQIIQVCEVSDPSFDTPMFITLFVNGRSVPQPSGYVLNFGLGEAYGIIGDPPKG